MSDPRPSPSSATRILVSVRNPSEAELVAGAGPCLIDAKDPEAGALGALPLSEIEAIVAAVGGRRLTSAVAGEPDDWDDLAECTARVATCGVDMIKVAWPKRSGPPAPKITERLRAIGLPVVAVFFAEARPGPRDVDAAAQAGFAGAMIDTGRKYGGNLLDRMTFAELECIVRTCRQSDLLSGLAGSLRPDDIARLVPMRASYLGFRGGLCHDGDRNGELQPSRIADALERLSDRITEVVR